MTGPELRAIRDRLGMTAEQFGRALGYQGERASIDMMISRMERGSRAVPKHVALVAPRLKCAKRASAARR